MVALDVAIEIDPCRKKIKKRNYYEQSWAYLIMLYYLGVRALHSFILELKNKSFKSFEIDNSYVYFGETDRSNSEGGL